MFRQVCIIETSFFKMTYASGMHRRPFQGRHLVIYKIVSFCFDIVYFIVSIRASKSLPIVSLPHQRFSPNTVDFNAERNRLTTLANVSNASDI